MFNTIRNLFLGKPAKKIATRLTEEQALKIGNNADIDPIYKENLRIAIPEENNGKVIWTVTSPSKGVKELIIIDDSTGEIIETRHVGVR